ncbi:hypothetical protein ACEPPN_011708 [Leptodophora sp. 'Broadleaf-Isolate-01']
MSIFGPGKTATSDEVESSTKTSDGVSPTPSGVFFKSNWTIPRIALNESTTLMYSIEESIDQRRPQLVLCQTSATGSPSISVSPDNSWTVTPRDGRSNEQIMCESYSQFFDIDENSTEVVEGDDNKASATATAANPPTPLETALLITQNIQVLLIDNVGSSSGPQPAPATTDFPTTLSASPSTVTPTVTATSAESAVNTADSFTKGGGGGSRGLSIGAKVGIALGALAFALILLILALLFLRRKHTKRNQPEQVMLTQSMHTDSFSRNLITEKEDPTVSAAATPIDEPTTALPIQRHSAVATYKPVSSAPYNGAAAAVPRRKPTAATMASTVSRGLSTTSGTSSTGARSPRPGDGFEQYHDVVPIYGDTRHVPQVYVGNSERGIQSPFLSEEGMTPEEVARLEEEERRIDAAIAEAERR